MATEVFKRNISCKKVSYENVQGTFGSVSGAVNDIGRTLSKTLLEAGTMMVLAGKNPLRMGVSSNG